MPYESFFEHPALEAWWYLARSFQRIVGQNRQDFAEYGLTGAQYGVIRCLGEGPEEGLPLSELSERLLMTCGNITCVVDKLEEAGLVRRERSVADRRVIHAQLTPRGRELFDRAVPAHRQRLQERFSGLSPAEQAELAHLLRRLYEALEATDGS
jgi:DNA-binding MarR family transcriptional regulator